MLTHIHREFIPSLASNPLGFPAQAKLFDFAPQLAMLIQPLVKHSVATGT